MFSFASSALLRNFWGVFCLIRVWSSVVHAYSLFHFGFFNPRGHTHTRLSTVCVCQYEVLRCTTLEEKTRPMPIKRHPEGNGIHHPYREGRLCLCGGVVCFPTSFRIVCPITSLFAAALPSFPLTSPDQPMPSLSPSIPIP